MIHFALPFARVPINESHSEEQIQGPIRAAEIAVARSRFSSDTRSLAPRYFRIAAHAALLSSSSSSRASRCFNAAFVLISRTSRQPKNKLNISVRRRMKSSPTTREGTFVALEYNFLRSSTSSAATEETSRFLAEECLERDVETCHRDVIRANNVVRFS